MIIMFRLFPEQRLKRIAKPFLGIAGVMKNSVDQRELKKEIAEAKFKISMEEYLGIAAFYSLFWLVIYILGAVAIMLFLTGLSANTGAAFSVIVIMLFIVGYFKNLNAVKLWNIRRTKGIDRNLIPALESLLVQLNSGVMLFDALAAVSRKGYGELSSELRETVKKIETGKDEMDAFEELANTTRSIMLRKVVRQIITGLKTGVEMRIIVKDLIDEFYESRIIQIQQYGSGLNPVAMMYMITAVIIPALSTTFIILLSMFFNLDALTTRTLLMLLFGVVFFMQIMFIGIARSRRPSLL